MTVKKQQQTAQPSHDGSWHDRGEFPPAGCVCEVEYRGEWIRVEIIGTDSSGYCVFEVPENVENAPSYDGVRLPSSFSPLRTEREKAIEDMSRVMHEHDSVINDVTLGALYDAGYRKVKP